eukprot:TRINITY_DN2820_c0_g2_i9.p1 TRINITY_DN2820_c0_g2~~TRINITY_DN2820_c0_g2_i9.p1  ORF type:complete len:144 (+),score=11.10 TRINITY_DN2820_c0_g2_i9:508-939(+)
MLHFIVGKRDVPDRIILFLLSDSNENLSADVKWCKAVNSLVAERAKFESAVAYVSTLGGAYATLKIVCEGKIRFHLILKSHKAYRFARQMYLLARRYGHRILEVKSLIFITLAQVYAGYLKQAKSNLERLFVLIAHVSEEEVI